METITRKEYDDLKSAIIPFSAVVNMDTAAPIYDWKFIEVQSAGSFQSNFKLAKCSNTGLLRDVTISEYHNKKPDAPRVQ